MSSGRIHDQCILRQLAQKVCSNAADHVFTWCSLHRDTKNYDRRNLRQAINGRSQQLYAAVETVLTHLLRMWRRRHKPAFKLFSLLLFPLEKRFEVDLSAESQVPVMEANEANSAVTPGAPLGRLFHVRTP